MVKFSEKRLKCKYINWRFDRHKLSLNHVDYKKLYNYRSQIARVEINGRIFNKTGAGPGTNMDLPGQL